MVGTVLLVLSEGFDDMAYLSTQVILEEAGNDVISTSPEGGAVKGATSSVMTVAFSEALEQDLDYSGLVIIGGLELDSIGSLPDAINSFKESNKLIAAFETGVELLSSLDLVSSISTDASIVNDNNVYTMKEPENCEDFAEIIADQLP